MSGAPRVRSMNVTDAEARPVLGPAGNKAGSVPARKPHSKPSRKAERTPELAKEEKKTVTSPVHGPSPPPSVSSFGVPSILRRHEQFLNSNLSLNASCSSDASTDSVQSRASTGRIIRTNPMRQLRKRQSAPKLDRSISDNFSVSSQDSLGSSKKRCAWVTPNTDPVYASFHDEEWGVPVHDDTKLFEFLVLSGALAELTWPNILTKRHIFREVFLDFNPALVAKLNEKKIVAPGSTASSLLSESKLRAIIENARQIVKIIEEFGSFDKYCWSFVNHKPIVSRFRYPRHVPAKTPKADVISKDLVRRGFRSVGPTVIYSFMQAAGITNDHLISCYRFEECVTVAGCDVNQDNKDKGKVEEMKKTGGDFGNLGLEIAINELDISEECL